ncbi:MAG: PQQ-binding-like beta-propeller repeat protein [Polyangiales bacterium]
MSFVIDETNEFPANRLRQQSKKAPAHHPEVVGLLLEQDVQVDIPSVAELTAAAASLATGARRKMLLPIVTSPIEFALVRSGHDILVSCYGTSTSPTVYQLDRRVNLRMLLDTCARATLADAQLETDPTARQIAVRVAERAMRTEVRPDPNQSMQAIVQKGGAIDPPNSRLAFGFEANINSTMPTSSTRSSRADIHAMLFEGSLWGYVDGRRALLVRGPIMLAVQRMVAAAASLLEAWDRGRPSNLRLRSGTFSIALRIDQQQKIALTLGASDASQLSLANLDLADAVLPILRLASDLVRSVVSTDRDQSRNLRMRALREEVRRIRREVRERTRTDGFTNKDPDRLRIDAPALSSFPPPSKTPTSLRFEQRWQVSLENLDSNAVFLCGDRLVCATSTHLVALDRNTGAVIWARSGAAATTMMAGRVLFRVLMDGEVELCDVENGEPFATTHIAPRIGGTMSGLMMGGQAFAPIAVLTEGAHRLVAIDVRTGEPRWRFASRTGGEFRLRRVGRILLVACGEGAIHAIDAATGEDAWRFSSPTRFQHRPAVCGETVIAAASLGSRNSEIVGIDLYSGHERWRQALSASPTADLISAGGYVLVATGSRGTTRLAAHDPTSGRMRWESEDPGVGRGGATLRVDEFLMSNSPAGYVCATDLRTGALMWSCELADPIADDIPRTLEPILRGGALFVPSSSVHVIRPKDGIPLSSHIPTDLVPDVLRVDERGWLYIAEESGHIAALAPTPHLTILPGGRRD